MKTKFILILTLFLLFSLALPGTALAASTNDTVFLDQFVFGDNYTLDSGETLDGNLFVFGGNATLEANSVVEGNIILFGGNLGVSGTVNGDITAMGGNISLNSTAVVDGDINLAGGSVDRDPLAVVNGEIINEFNSPFWVTRMTDISTLVPRSYGFPEVWAGMNPGFQFLRYLISTVLWAFVAMLVAMLLTRHTERVSKAITKEPLATGGLGCLTILVAPLVIILLAITICLIPFSLLIALLLVITWAFGVIAVGLELGKRVAQIFKTEWHPALAAGIGTLFLMLVVNGIGIILPCLSWIPQLLVGILGLGGVLLTRYGTQDYPAETAAMPPVLDLPGETDLPSPPPPSEL